MILFQSLASGSSGNAFLLRTGKVSILFDAGLRYESMARYLRSEMLEPEKLSAIFISHEHRDHCAGARDLSTLHDVPVIANSEVLRAAGFHELRRAEVVDVGSSVRLGDVEVTSFPVEHDAVRPVGFLIRACGRTICLATDLGRPTPAVAAAVEDADLVVIEANHDLDMLENGRYPRHLRRRVSGPTGHLSNTQTGGLLTQHVRRAQVDVWLAHLSKENNTAALAMRTVKRYLKASGQESVRVDVALRDRPSLRWTGEPRPHQLHLFADHAGTQA